MRIDTLSIKNLRLFGDEEQEIHFDSSKNITVFLGDNGAGKTSILYGCSVLLSQFYKFFPNCPVKQLTNDDVRTVSSTNKADFAQIGLKLVPSHPGILEHSDIGKPYVSATMTKKGNETKSAPNSDLSSIHYYSSVMKQMVDNGNPVALPIIAFYGTERGHIKPVERRRNFHDVFPRWEVYGKDSLSSATDFKRFFMWFERNEDIERREWKRIAVETGNTENGYTSYVLDSVRKALNSLFPNQLQNPRVEMSPLRFVMDDITDPQNRIERRLEHMSDGYRITIALVADIAARLAEANPSPEESGIDNPMHAPGIVMIDEIDLHLHPKLQRDILRRLTNIFPNVQFIVSTHSPNVVMGALDIIQIIKLKDGKIDSKINEHEYETYDISLLLLSDLFEGVDVRTDEYLRENNEYENLLSKSQLTEQDNKRIDELGKKLKRFSSHEIEMFQEMLNIIKAVV